MRHSFLILFAGIFLLLSNTLCKKADSTKFKQDLAIESQSTLITAARSFFKTDIESTQAITNTSGRETFNRHQVNKTPLWEHAYIKYTKIKGNAIVVPLKFEKPLNIKTSFSNGAIVSIEKQSNLWIYKDATGKYRAEVVIILPDKNYMEGITKAFSGYILEEDWSGNRINTFRYRDGKEEQIKKPIITQTDNTASREVIECTVIDWYECDDIDEW